MSRRIWNFPGGIHPEENKKQSKDKPIRKASIPEKLILPLQQHIGSPANPIVIPGEKVLKGQLIAEASSFISAHVHAPTSGTVVDIGLYPVQHPSGIDGECIVIEPDYEDQWIPHEGIEDFAQVDPSLLLDKIRSAGIAGMGGAGFPTSVKLNPVSDSEIETLILNAVECEPFITADDLLMQERAHEIIGGLLIMAHILKPKEILVGIEDNKPEAIHAMEQAALNTPIEIVVVPTKYPSGGEKQLIYMLTGKEVNSGSLPANIGVICQNTGTAYAIYRAVVHGEPLISRITTLSGEAMNSKGNVEVLLGTPVSHLLQEGQTIIPDINRLIMGGPMMGFTISNIEIPVVKITNCILASTREELPNPEPENPCIRCGECANVCPAQLLPQQMFFYSKAQEFEKTRQYHIMDCIECGACSYVCPSNIPLVQYFRFAKGNIRKQTVEKLKADKSRGRFEFHKARLEKEAAEKESKRKARAEAARKKAASKKDPSEASKSNDNKLLILKTAAATANKKFIEAKKALVIAEKNGADNIDTLKEKIKQLQVKAEEASAALKKTQDESKEITVEQKDLSEQISKTENKINELREISAQATDVLKSAKKALLSAKSSDTINEENLKILQDAVAEAKVKADSAKTALREALKGQKNPVATDSPKDTKNETEGGA